MLGPDRERCHPWTRGVLHHYTVIACDLVRIGKESNPLLAADDPVPDDPAIEYRPRVCPCCGEPVTGRRKWCGEACRKRSQRAQTP
jgi:hypothetical protein